MMRVGGQSGTDICNTTSSARAGVATPPKFSAMAVAATALKIGSFVFQLIRFSLCWLLLAFSVHHAAPKRRAVIAMEKMRSGGSKEKLSRSPWLVKASRLRLRQDQLAE